MYIRLWAPTDLSGASETALSYARALLRLAPVRLISLTGMLDTRDWRTMTSLLMTPMAGDMINVVCSSPAYWIKHITVAMPERDTMRESLTVGEEVPTKVEREVMEREIWTSLAARNVLIATSLPNTKRQAEAANRYEALIVPAPDLALSWSSRCASLGTQTKYLPTIVPVPIQRDAMQTLRGLVIGWD
jgi:hypothetical protein